MADDTPFFIKNGMADFIITPIQNWHIVDTLSAVIGIDKVTHISFHCGGYGGSQFDMVENPKLVIGFLCKYLMNATCEVQLNDEA